MLRILLLTICTCALAIGANWLTARGDAQRTGWQRQEKTLNARTVKTVHLLWKMKLGDSPNGLTDPLILGSFITHRGIKELVFVRNSSDRVYAIDADLGSIYWSRDLPVATVRSCAKDLRVMPIMAPQPIKEVAEGGDDFSDGNKPLYVFAANGSLYALRPSTGENFSPPLSFLPLRARPIDLAITANTLSVTTAAVCGGVANRLWNITLNVSDSQTGFDPHSHLMSGKDDGKIAFDLKGQHLVAEGDRKGNIVFRQSAADPLVMAVSGGLATWQDGRGTRWILMNRKGNVAAFRITGDPGHPDAALAWSSDGQLAIGAPVVANGIAYFISTSDTSKTVHLILRAIDALSGAELYNSGNEISSAAAPGNLAIANGHVSFSTAEGILYCFGIPFEM